MKKVCVFLMMFFGVLSVHAQFRVDRLISAGRSALYYEDYVLSIQYFNLAINSKPYLYEPWYLRAVAKYNLDDFVGAEKDVGQAINLNPYYNEMYDLRAICRIRQNKFKEAISDYNEAIRIDPRNQNYWFNRALCHFQEKDYTGTQDQLDTIISKWKDFANAFSLKAEVCLIQKDTTEAAKMLDKSLTYDPYNVGAWRTRGLISMNRHQWKDADNFLTKAIHFEPKAVDDYLNRALARLNYNNLRGALSDYDLAIEYDPNNFLAHYNRGLLRVNLGDNNRAITDFDFVVNMEPKNPLALFNRAILLEKTGHIREAIRDYTTVIGQFPNFWTGLAYRARCYRKIGMAGKAELDEFRIFKAQMNKAIGVQPRWSQKTRKLVRKRSEFDINKYNRIVVPDEQAAVHTEDYKYKSVYRGKVQDRTVTDNFLPMYTMSLVEYNNGINTYQAFDENIEKFNHKVNPKYPIYLNCSKGQLTDEKSLAFFNYVDQLSKQISETKDVQKMKSLLFERAVAYSVLQDFEEADNDLTAYIQIDDQNALAYWQRAVCQSRLNAVNQSQGSDVALSLNRMRADFDDAIRLSPNNAYLFYNRGNFHADHKEYSQAIDDYTRAIQIDPRLAEAWYNRGLARILSDNKATGINDLSKAGELGLYDAYSVIKKYETKK